MTNAIIQGYHAKLLEDLNEFFDKNAIPDAETQIIMLYAEKALAELRGEVK